LISHVVATDNAAHGILMFNSAGGGGIIRDSTASHNTLDGIQVLGSVLVVDNSSFSNGGSQIHVYNCGNRKRFEPASRRLYTCRPARRA
jgi:hypothetical protein